MRSTRRDASQFSSVSGIASALTLETTTSIPPSWPAAASHPGGERGAVPDVAHAAEDRPAGDPDRGVRRRDLPGVPGAEGDVRALGHEALDDGAADALGAAGDDAPAAGELEIHEVPAFELGGGVGLHRPERGRPGAQVGVDAAERVAGRAAGPWRALTTTLKLASTTLATGTSVICESSW